MLDGTESDVAAVVWLLNNARAVFARNAELENALAEKRAQLAEMDREHARIAELEQRDGYVVLCGDFDYEDVQLVGERVFADLEFALDAADGAGGTVYELREVKDRG
ncbi:hypothetical protein ACFXG4_04825 [Nocardia sp. NPDC059246]|uniref:hypothetical protein n=1 Tax=unclassified Nocardia TaxID=2637762 RepID=UPI0036B51425